MDNRDFPLHKAVDDENIDLVLDLIKKGARINVNVKNNAGLSPLHISVTSENLRITQLLIDAGACMDDQERESGKAPLHSCVETNNIHIMKLLVKSGADINIGDVFRYYTPLHRAVELENLNMVKFLLHSGADVNSMLDGCSDTPVQLVSQKAPNEDILELLIGSRADVNIPSRNGRTPLISAAHNSHLRIMNSLMRSGAVVNSPDCDKHEAFVLLLSGSKFQQVDFEETVKLLIEGTDINHVNRHGNNNLNDFLKQLLLSPKRKYFYKMIIGHIAKLKSLNYEIDSRLLDTITNASVYNNYFTMCMNELKKAKDIKFIRIPRLTFYNLIVDGLYKFIKYIKNYDIDEEFHDNIDQFFIYGKSIRIDMAEAIVGRDAFDRARHMLSYYLPCLEPHHAIVRNTLDILEMDDWKKLRS